MAGRLDGKIAIVTGTATGIGSATARLFAKEGAKVYAVDIKEPGVELAAALKEYPATMRFGRLDVRSEEEWAATLAACKDGLRPAQCPHQQRRHRFERQAGA